MVSKRSAPVLVTSKPGAPLQLSCGTVNAGSNANCSACGARHSWVCHGCSLAAADLEPSKLEISPWNPYKPMMIWWKMIETCIFYLLWMLFDELPCFCKSGIWTIWLCFGCAFAAKLQVLAETGRAKLSKAELRWFCLVFQKLRQRLRHIFLRMALSLLRASECCQAVMCSSGSYSNPQKDLTGRK